MFSCYKLSRYKVAHLILTIMQGRSGLMVKLSNRDYQASRMLAVVPYGMFRAPSIKESIVSETAIEPERRVSVSPYHN